MKFFEFIEWCFRLGRTRYFLSVAQMAIILAVITEGLFDQEQIRVGQELMTEEFLNFLATFLMNYHQIYFHDGLPCDQRVLPLLFSSLSPTHFSTEGSFYERLVSFITCKTLYHGLFVGNKGYESSRAIMNDNKIQFANFFEVLKGNPDALINIEKFYSEAVAKCVHCASREDTEQECASDIERFKEEISKKLIEIDRTKIDYFGEFDSCVLNEIKAEKDLCSKLAVARKYSDTETAAIVELFATLFDISDIIFPDPRQRGYTFYNGRLFPSSHIYPKETALYCAFDGCNSLKFLFVIVDRIIALIEEHVPEHSAKSERLTRAKESCLKVFYGENVETFYIDCDYFHDIVNPPIANRK